MGDRVPADVRLVKLKTATLRCEQASLTGESVAVQKGTEPLTDEDCELQVLTPEWLLSGGSRWITAAELAQCLACRFCAHTSSSSSHPRVLKPSGVASQAKDNMLFAATAVANGAGTGIVNSIGMATEIGKIQAQIQEAAKEEDDTPLKKKIDEFGELLAKVGA